MCQARVPSVAGWVGAQDWCGGCGRVRRGCQVEDVAMKTGVGSSTNASRMPPSNRPDSHLAPAPSIRPDSQPILALDSTYDLQSPQPKQTELKHLERLRNVATKLGETQGCPNHLCGMCGL